MQIELPRSKQQYSFSGRKLQLTKAHLISPHDELLGFDVPRRRRSTFATRPRDIHLADLWFLPSSKNSTRDTSPGLEVDDEDEEALIAEALLNIARAAAADTTTYLAASKRNGCASANGSRTTVGVSTSGSWYHGASVARKRRPSYDLLAGEDDLVEADEIDAVHPFSDGCGSPQRADDALPFQRKREVPRRGRPVASVSNRLPSGASPLSSQLPLTNGRNHIHFNVRGSAVTVGVHRGGSSRMGRNSGAAMSDIDEQYRDGSGKPPPAFLIDGTVVGGMRPLNGAARGSPALFGHSSFAAARAANRAAAALSAGQVPVVSLVTSSIPQRSSEALGIGKSAETPIKEEPAGTLQPRGSVAHMTGGESSGRGTPREGPSRRVDCSTGVDRQGSLFDLPSERITPGVAGGGGQPWPGGSEPAGVKPEPSNSAPNSPKGDGAATTVCYGRQLADGGAVTSCRTASVPAPVCPAANKMQTALSGPTQPLAELLSGDAAPMGTWFQLSRLLPGAGAQWAPPSASSMVEAASGPIAKGLQAGKVAAGGTAPPQQPPATPPVAVLSRAQQLHLQQQQQVTILKAAAAMGMSGASVGLPPGCVEYLRALQTGGQATAAALAALAGHPLALNVLAAAAACGLLPPGAAGALTLPSPVVAGSGNGANGGASGGVGGAAFLIGPGAVIRGSSFRRCAQHVHIAHFIAQQQQRLQQQQQQQQRTGVSGSGIGLSVRQQQQQQSDTARAGSSSPGAEHESPGLEQRNGPGGNSSTPSPAGGGNGVCNCSSSGAGDRLQPHNYHSHSHPPPLLSSMKQSQPQSPAVNATAAAAAAAGAGTKLLPVQLLSGLKAEADMASSLAVALPGPLGSGRSSLLGQAHQSAVAALAPPLAHQAAAAAAAATAAAGPPVCSAAVTQGTFLGPLSGFPGSLAAIMAAIASGGIPGVSAAATAAAVQHHHAVAAATAVAASAGTPIVHGGQLVLQRGPAGPPQPLAPPVTGPLGVGPGLPPHVAQLFIGPTSGAAAAAAAAAATSPNPATSGFVLPTFVSGLPAPFSSSTAAGSTSLPTFAAGGGSFSPGGPGAMAVLSAAAAASQLAPFFGSALPPHFAEATPGPANMVLQQHLSSAAAHHFAAQ